jgi:hypothetical protein
VFHASKPIARVLATRVRISAHFVDSKPRRLCKTAVLLSRNEPISGMQMQSPANQNMRRTLRGWFTSSPAHQRTSAHMTASGASMLAENEGLPQFSSDVVQYSGRDGCSYSTSLQSEGIGCGDWLNGKQGFWPRYPCAAIGIEGSLRLSKMLSFDTWKTRS